MNRTNCGLRLPLPAVLLNSLSRAASGHGTDRKNYNTMKPHWILILAVLAICPAVAMAAGVEHAFETVDYEGRLTVAGQPFTGKGNFKFALLRKDGTRLWTSGDNEPPIEEGVPSGSVTLSVQDGIYRVRLGDPNLGMKMLTSGRDRQASQVLIWFNDGKHGWSHLGIFDLVTNAGRAAATAAPDATNTDMAAILSELRALRTEVAELRGQFPGAKDRPAAPPPMTSTQPVAKPEVKPVFVIMQEAKRHSLGKADAPVVLVEFTDYECGYCKRFFEQTFPLLKRDFIDTGKLRFISRNMPAAAHPQAEPAALALLGAAERADDYYWKMRAWLFANQRDLGPAGLARYAEEAGLDRATLLADNAARKHGAEIQEDLAAARSVGITGTPSFVLGTSDGQIIRGERITGAKSFQMFESRIQALLAKAGSPMTVNEAKSR